jgi:hypothetical protein
MAKSSTVSAAAGPSPRELRLLRRAALAADQTAISRARHDFPGNKDVLKYAGILHYRRKEYAAAEVALTEALKLDPEDAEAALFLMRALYNVEALEKCETAARNLLRLAPDHPDALRILGRIYNKRRTWVEAASVWQRLTETSPDNAEAPYQAARAFDRQARHAEALIFANKALTADPNNGEAARIKIDILIASGDADHMPIVDTIAAYYRLDPDRALGLVQRLAREERVESSAAIIAALIKAYPDDHTVSRLAATMTAAWQAEALRSEVQGKDDKAAGYAAALRLIKPSSFDRKALEPAPVGTEALVDGRMVPEPHVITAPEPVHASTKEASNWRARLSRWVRLVWRGPRRVLVTETVQTVAAADPIDPQEAAPSNAELLRHAQSLDTEDNAGALRDAPAAALPAQPSGQEAMRIRARAMLASGAIDDAAAAVAPIIQESIDEARAWLAGQPEIWTSLVGAKAFARSAMDFPDRSDLALAADLAGIECLADGFEHEIAGDLVRAFVGFYAAASVRPADHDAMLGVARVREGCRAQLLGDSADTAAHPPATVVLLALSRV